MCVCVRVCAYAQQDNVMWRLSLSSDWRDVPCFPPVRNTSSHAMTGGASTDHILHTTNIMFISRRPARASHHFHYNEARPIEETLLSWRLTAWRIRNRELWTRECSLVKKVRESLIYKVTDEFVSRDVTLVNVIPVITRQLNKHLLSIGWTDSPAPKRTPLAVTVCHSNWSSIWS